MGNQYLSLGGINNIIFGATLKSEIGSAQNAAENCFGPVARHIWALGSNPFSYHYFDDSAEDNCQEPQDRFGFVKNQVQDPGENCDDDSGIFGLIDPDGDGEDGVNPNTGGGTGDTICSIIFEEVTKANTEVVNRGGDDVYTIMNEKVDLGTVADPELTRYEEILDQWVQYALYVGMKARKYNELDDCLCELKPWRWKKRCYGLKILEGDIPEAKEILMNLPVDTEDQIYFKEVQEYYLDFLEQGEDRELVSAADRQAIMTLAESDSPCMGYARSLYHLITDDFVPITLIEDILANDDCTKGSILLDYAPSTHTLHVSPEELWCDDTTRIEWYKDQHFLL